MSFTSRRAGQTLLAGLAVLWMSTPAAGQSGAPRAGEIQQQVEAGAMLPGQRLLMWVLVEDLAAGQDVSVRIEPSRPVERVDPGCTPDGTSYVCNFRAGPLFSTKTFQLEFVAGAPGTFTLTSRIVHSGVSDTDALEVLPQPVAGRTVALVDDGSCTHGHPITALTPGASAFTSICPGRTLPVGSRFRTNLLRAALYWTRGGRILSARLKDPTGGDKAAATVVQPRGRALELRLAKPRGCRGYEGIEAGSNATGGLRIVGRLVRVTFKKGSVGVTEYCNRAVIGARSRSVVIRDLVHGRTVRLGARSRYVVRR